VVEFGHVGEVEGAVEFFGGRFAEFGLEVGDDDLGTFGDEFGRDGFAEALAWEGALVWGVGIRRSSLTITIKGAREWFHRRGLN
jgi:hypothetical protein